MMDFRNAFEYDFVKLRDFREDDFSPFHALHSNPAALRYYGMLPVTSEDDARRLWGYYREENERGESFRKVITLNDGDDYIGDCGIMFINRIHARGEIYLIISPLYQNRGVSLCVNRILLNHAFSELGLNRIQARIDPRNIAARKSFHKTGFKTEGILRQYEYEQGEYIDIEMLSILRCE